MTIIHLHLNVISSRLLRTHFFGNTRCTQLEASTSTWYFRGICVWLKQHETQLQISKARTRISKRHSTKSPRISFSLTKYTYSPPHYHHKHIVGYTPPSWPLFLRLLPLFPSSSKRYPEAQSALFLEPCSIATDLLHDLAGPFSHLH